MPTWIRRLTANGLAPVDYTADSLGDAVRYEPQDGVYTVANTMNTYNVVKLTAHLDRLNDSATREGIAYTLPQTTLREGLRALIALSGCDEVRFRVTVPRDTPNEPILSAEPFVGYPEAYYTDGVRVITVRDVVRTNAEAKGTRWMHDRRHIEATLPDGAHTAILVGEDGALLEGVGSSFYAILRNTLYTAIDGVLPATSHQIVFETAPDIVPLVRRPIHLDDVPHIEEAFISSSSRGIMPVVQIDDVVIGDGVPSYVTKQLRRAYLNWMQTYIELI